MTPYPTTLVYDGYCPLCQNAARYYRLRQAVGDIHTIDMRHTPKNDPVIQRIAQSNLDLNQGMVFIYQNRLYHGVDALHLMALLGSHYGWFNKLNSLLFRYKSIAQLCYPIFKKLRLLALHLKIMRGTLNKEQLKY